MRDLRARPNAYAVMHDGRQPASIFPHMAFGWVESPNLLGYGTLASEGMTVLLVEQNTERVLRVAADICVLESGRTVWQGTAAAARLDPQLSAAYLGLH